MPVFVNESQPAFGLNNQYSNRPPGISRAGMQYRTFKIKELIMIDFNNDEPISLNKLAKHLGVHPSACHRWAKDGIQGHVLQSFMLGGRRCTTWPSFTEWLRRRNGGEEPGDFAPLRPIMPIAPPPTTCMEWAERELDRMLNTQKKRCRKKRDG